MATVKNAGGNSRLPVSFPPSINRVLFSVSLFFDSDLLRDENRFMEVLAFNNCVGGEKACSNVCSKNMCADEISECRKAFDI